MNRIETQRLARTLTLADGNTNLKLYARRIVELEEVDAAAERWVDETFRAMTVGLDTNDNLRAYYI